MSYLQTNISTVGSSPEGTVNCCRILTEFNPTVQLDQKKRYAIGMRTVRIKNVVMNISSSIGNNKFYYTNSASTSRTITFPDGVYDLNEINTIITRYMDITGSTEYSDNAQGARTYCVKLGVSAAAARFQWVIQADCSVVATASDTFREILGFDSGTYTDMFSTAQNVPDIQPVSEVLLHCNLINSTSYLLDSDNRAVLGSVYNSYILSSSPGEYLNLERYGSDIKYVEISNAGSLSRIEFWLSDTNGLDLAVRTNNEMHFKIHYEIVEIIEPLSMNTLISLMARKQKLV